MESSISQLDTPGRRGARVVLRLFVAGKSPAYRRAVRCVRTFCDEELADNYDLEIVDITLEPEIAEQMNVLATPTLIKTSPAPVQRICGDLSDRAKLVAELLPTPP